MTTDDIMWDILKVIGKGQMEAHVFLPAFLREAFRKYMQARRSRGTNRVLLSGQDESLTYDGLQQEIYQVSAKAGIKFSVHRAMRFYAGFLYKQGLTLKN